ncbi:NACHT, LRR and PYD domains-containing protein 4 [Rhynchocyon petersi]
MESSFLSGFGLILYLEELQKEEFKKFKTFLKQESLPSGLKHIPWAEVKKASREELADLLNKHYGERQAWDVALTVFDKINRKDLYEKAKTEGPGHTKRYQAHLKKRLRNVWFKGESLIAAHSSLEQRENEYMEDLFASKATGAELPRTVVFIGTRKLGKTTFLIKLMLAWAEGTIYRERFSYVFYFCCREVRQLMATSLSELISRGWPDGSAPIEEILSQPNRLLFIIDSFEKLTCDLEEAELDVCSDCTQEQPAEVILTGLLKKKMLPESSMLIAATPECLEELQTQLENPNVEIMGGLDEQGRKLYFSCTFQNKKQAMHAFNSVKGNEQLYAMCQIPVICWVACSCLKQEMEKGRNVTLTCHRNTSLFTTFILNTFIAKDATRPRQQNRLQLEGLCFLAVEGMWTDTFEFSEEDLRRNGLGKGDIPAFLDMKILQKSWGYENSYSFIHVCVQEFFAALFYMLKKPSDHPNTAVKDVETLLTTYTLIRWHGICSVLTTNEHLRELRLFNSVLNEPALVILGNELKSPSCHIEKIGLNGCHLTGRCCEDLASVLSSSKTLRRLNLNENTLDHDGVAVLCEALKHPNCALKELG